MPNGDSLYSTFAAAGKVEGSLEAQKVNIQAIKDTISSETQKLEFDQQKREEGIDLFATALDTASTLYEGHLSQKDLGTYQKGVQTQAAKELFGKDYTPEQLETLKPTKLTGKGKEWGKASRFEKAVSYATGDSQYRFGEGEGAYKMSKADIMFAGEASKHGVKTDLSMYKEAESSLQKRLREDRAAVDLGGDYQDMEWAARSESEKELASKQSSSGKYYGGKKGFDLGDIVGEKSIFAPGKQKLSSILSKFSSPDQEAPPSSKQDDVVLEESAVYGRDEERFGVQKTSPYGSKENPFRAKGVGDVFNLAKAAGMKAEGQTLYSQWGEGPMKSWAYSYGK